MAIESSNQSPVQIGNNNVVNYVFNVIVENRQLAVIAGLLAVAFVVLFFNRKPNYDENETVKLLLAHYKQQLDVKDEQIKNITAAAVRAVHDKGALGLEAIEALKLGNTEKAKDLFKRSIQQGEINAKQTAEDYRNLGAIAFLDNTQEALDAYRRATSLDPDNADGWNQLGLLFNRVGELEQAITAYQTVLKLGDQEKIVWAYGNLGNVYQTRGDLDKAIDFYQKSLAIAESLDMKESMAKAYDNLGLVYTTRSELDKAIEFHNKALAINQVLDNKESMALNYGNLGIVYHIRGDLDKAIDFYQKSLAITESLGMKETSANQYANLGNVYELKGNKAEAKRYWQKSIELYKTIGSPNEKLVQGWLNDLK